MKITAILLLLAFSIVPADTGKNKKIKKLLEVTSALEIGKQFAAAIGSQLEESIKALNETIPDDVITLLYSELNKELDKEMDLEGGLVTDIIKIYAKYYTEKEIDELIKFYQTPVGKKTIKNMPSIMQESMQVGQAWGQKVGAEIASRVLKKIEKKGYKIPPI